MVADKFAQLPRQYLVVAFRNYVEVDLLMRYLQMMGVGYLYSRRSDFIQFQNTMDLFQTLASVYLYQTSIMVVSSGSKAHDSIGMIFVILLETKTSTGTFQ